MVQMVGCGSLVPLSRARAMSAGRMSLYGRSPYVNTSHSVTPNQTINYHHHHHHFICSKTKDEAIQTKDMDVEQHTPGSDKLLRWPSKKNTVTHKYTKYSNCTKPEVHVIKAI